MGNKKWDEILKGIVSKKYAANILVLMAVALMALIVSSEFLMKESSTKKITKDPFGDTLVQQVVQPRSEEEIVEQRLKNILESIRGAGEVDVMITFEMGSEIIPATNVIQSKDVTEERDASGGTRQVISESSTGNIVTTNDNSGNKPLVLKEIKPQVKGVIVVAEGADNLEVKSQLYDAVKTVLQVPGHRVQVYSKN